MPHFFEGYATKFAPHKALKLIARGNLTFEERIVVHRMAERLDDAQCDTVAEDEMRRAGFSGQKVEQAYTFNPKP